MKRIKNLSKNLINTIAAGEVIERPANVVKELVENSIDAGATKIEISVSNECRNFRIADNGSGIHPDDIELAFVKHATSKLTDEEGLFNIQTLGFRGEALASIIAVSKVNCTTKTEEFDYGIVAEAENSCVKFSKTGCAKGTIMEVKDLFYNQPARLKFLKNPKTEFSYIQEYVRALAVSRPEIAFVLKNNGTDIINTAVDSDLLMRIDRIYPSGVINELREINEIDKISNIKITGYASVPSYTRSGKKSIYTFVNGRTVKCPVLLKSVETAYKNMLPAGRYPLVVINLEVNPEDIDVNAHPTKREIRYKNPNQIFNFVLHAISTALNSRINNFIPELIEEQTVIPFKKPDNPDKDDDSVEISLETIQTKPLFPFVADDSENLKLNFVAPKPQKTENLEISFESDLNKNEKRPCVIGQYKNTYILVENDDNLEIIDQHIADERYIYEKLKKEKTVASQLLIVSDVLDVDPTDIAILDEAGEKLEKFGYKIEKISSEQIIFKKIPQVLSKVKPQDILSELLKNLKDVPEADLDTKEENILITTSCKAAVKAGDKLTLWQMEEIIKNLRKTENPYTCPHGRPISHFIPHKELASFFNRNV